MSVPAVAVNTVETPFKGALNTNSNIITIKSWEEYCHVNRLQQKLEASLTLWKSKPNINGVLVEVAEAHTEWITVLIEHGFTFHHCKQTYVVLSHWISKVALKSSQLEGISNTLIGTNSIVTDGNKVLVMHDLNAKPPVWKLPLGFIKEDEDISEGARRTLFDSCNIQSDFSSIVAFCHNVKGYLFNCSEMYFVVHLTAVSTAIRAELIDKYKWIQISEFLKYPENLELSRLFLQKYLQNEECKSTLEAQSVSHQQFHTHDITVYSIEHKSSQNKVN